MDGDFVTFYRLIDDGTLVRGDRVTAPGWVLTPETRGQFTFPHDGWWWFDTLAEAVQALNPQQLAFDEPDDFDPTVAARIALRRLSRQTAAMRPRLEAMHERNVVDLDRLAALVEQIDALLAVTPTTLAGVRGQTQDVARGLKAFAGFMRSGIAQDQAFIAAELAALRD